MIKNTLGAILIAPFVSLSLHAAEMSGSDDAGQINSKGGPVYNVSEEGTVDWTVFNGYRRYNASCIHCHGPDGLGSTIGPSLTEALKKISYKDFRRITAEGTKTIGSTRQSVMPPFGKDPNIRCYIDDIYVYLKSRSDGKIPRGRPQKKKPRTNSWEKAEEDCLGTKAPKAD